MIARSSLSSKASDFFPPRKRLRSSLLHLGVIYKAHARLNQVASNSLMARVETHKSMDSIGSEARTILINGVVRKGASLMPPLALDLMFSSSICEMSKNSLETTNEDLEQLPTVKSEIGGLKQKLRHARYLLVGLKWGLKWVNLWDEIGVGLGAEMGVETCALGAEVRVEMAHMGVGLGAEMGDGMDSGNLGGFQSQGKILGAFYSTLSCGCPCNISMEQGSSNDPMMKSSLSAMLHKTVLIASKTTVGQDGIVHSYCGLKLSDLPTPISSLKDNGSASTSRQSSKPVCALIQHSSNCCQERKLTPPSPNLWIPPPLKTLIDYTILTTSKFREQIRVYNSMFYFTSFCANIDHSVNSGRAPYTFRINGQNYHCMGSFLPAEGVPPRYAQLYFFDTQNEIMNRMSAFMEKETTKKVDENTVAGLIQMLD
ncbi:hypothetical protein Tco_1420570 [Tanacetum coccineum]